MTEEILLSRTVVLNLGCFTFEVLWLVRISYYFIPCAFSLGLPLVFENFRASLFPKSPVNQCINDNVSNFKLSCLPETKFVFRVPTFLDNRSFHFKKDIFFKMVFNQYALRVPLYRRNRCHNDPLPTAAVFTYKNISPVVL